MINLQYHFKSLSRHCLDKVTHDSSYASLCDNIVDHILQAMRLIFYNIFSVIPLLGWFEAYNYNSENAIARESRHHKNERIL